MTFRQNDLADIAFELSKAAIKYGSQSERYVWWLARLESGPVAAYAHLIEMTAVLQEESGEAARAVLHNEGTRRLREEVIQVLGVGFAILDYLAEYQVEPYKRLRQ